MNLDKYTQKSQEAILQAQQLARDLHHQAIEPAHLLLALLRQDGGVVPAIVTKVAGSVQALRAELMNELDNRPKIQGAGGDVGLAPDDRRRADGRRALCQGDAGRLRFHRAPAARADRFHRRQAAGGSWPDQGRDPRAR